MVMIGEDLRSVLFLVYFLGFKVWIGDFSVYVFICLWCILGWLVYCGGGDVVLVFGGVCNCRLK